jgi:hypothetical protein
MVRLGGDWLNQKEHAVKLSRVLASPLGFLYADAFVLRRPSKRRKHAWIVAAPKSGSTWLTALLADSLRWRLAELVPGHDQREQEIDLRQLMLHSRHANLLSPHQHCRHSSVTEEIVRKANIKVILQIRNIFDTVVSVRDHFDNESVRVPMAYMDDLSWSSLSEPAKLSFVVEMVVPWFFNFYCGWMTSSLLDTGRVHVSTYDRLRRDPVAALAKILEFLGEHRDEADLRRSVAACERKSTRKNRAVAGRGLSRLSAEHQARIRHYASYYQGVDFAPLGLADAARDAAA